MKPNMDRAPEEALARRALHWKKTRKLTLVLLLSWAFAGFFSVFYARQLYAFSLFGWPLSFYLAAQGSALVYLALIGFYAWRMRRLDNEYRDRTCP